MKERTNSYEELYDQKLGGISAPFPSSSSILHVHPGEPLSSPKITNKPKENGECIIEKQPNNHSSDVFEELFCPSLSPAALAPFALSAHPGPHSDVLKGGCLGKQEHRHRKYFVLRAGSHSGPSRLEWYKTEGSFKAVEKCAGEIGLFSTHKRGVIFLRCCLGVSLISSPRKEYKVALYAKEQTLVLVCKDLQEQHEWYTAVKELMEEEQMDGNGEGFDEEDAGYCTLPLSSYYKQVWPVTVKPRGLGRSKALAGDVLLCLTASALVMVRSGRFDLPSVTLPLLTVRRFGHLDGSFFLELGRSVVHGPGEIWMEPRDEGNSAVAQQIHEVVREAVRSLRVIPDFSRSASPSKSSSSHSQVLPALKRSRPKRREKLIHGRTNGSTPLKGLSDSLHSQNQRDGIKLLKDAQNSESTSLSLLSAEICSEPEADSYMEMKTDHSPVRARKAEGRGYMLMSTQTTLLHQDDYMTMNNPQKHDQAEQASLSFLQSSFSSGPDSPQHIPEQTPPPWTLYSGQVNARPMVAWATSSPVNRVEGLKPVPLFNGRGFSPDTAGAPEQSFRICLLSCLPSCLQPRTND